MLRRTFSFWITLCLLSFASITPTYAQAGKAVSRIVQKIFKEGAKEGAEKAGKEAVLNTADVVVKKNITGKTAKDITYHKLSSNALKYEKKEVKESLEKAVGRATSFSTDIIRVSAEKEAKQIATNTELLSRTINKSFVSKDVILSGDQAILQELKRSAGEKTLQAPVKTTSLSDQAFKQIEEKAARVGRNGAAQYYENLVKKKAPQLGLTDELQQKLLKDIDSNSGLAELIRKNPDFNISRWLETMKSVDKNKLAKLPNGKKPINYQYAGKHFYFEPSLNKNVDAQLRKKGLYNGYNRDQLKALDKMYPDGIPFDEQGFPDFIKAGLCKKGPKGENIIVDMPNGFTGVREKDFEIARNVLREQGITIDEFGYIWHHLPGNPSRMALIKTEAHEIIKHTGGHSLAKAAM